MAVSSPTPRPEAALSETGTERTSPRPAGRGIRGLAMLIAVLFAPLTAYWSANSLVDTIFSLMVPPVVMTMIVAALNLAVRRLAPRYALTEGELILFFGMHTVMGAISAEWMAVINPAIHSFALFRESDTRIDTYLNPYTN